MSNISQYLPIGGKWDFIENNYIGRGSFGTVYKAKSNVDNSISAIKHIPIPSDGTTASQLVSDGLITNESLAPKYYEDMLNALISKIKIINSISGHSNVVKVIEEFVFKRKNNAGYDVFIVMEYLEPLTEYIKNKKISEDEVAKIGLDICNALVALKSKGIIHRDIKPENMFFDSSSGKFKLGDFGEAKNLFNTSGVSLKGTQGYIAPEIFYHYNVDYRSDIYSLGMTMYKLLNNNRFPFLPTTETISADMIEEAIGRMLNGEDIPNIASCKNRRLFRCVKKACAYQPNDRWNSVESFIGELISAKQNPEYFDAPPIPNNVPHNNPPYNNVPYNNVPYNNMPHNNPPYNNVPHNNPPYNNVPHNNPPYNNVPHNNPPYNNVPHNSINNSRKNGTTQPVKKSLDATAVAIVIILLAIIIVVVSIVFVITKYGKNTDNNNNDSSSTSQSEINEEVVENKITLENYTNKDVDTVKSELEDLGLQVDLEYAEDNNIKSNKIVSQSLPEGSLVDSGTSIVLIVSKGAECPYEYSEKITVKDDDGDCYGTLKLYDWVDGEWKEQFSCKATVGKNGIGTNYGEGKKITPKGTFKLGVVLSSKNLDIDLPYTVVSDSTCIVDDIYSGYYNIIKDISSVPSGTSVDHTGRAIVKNGSADIFIEHNGDGFTSDNVVSGRGSAITICGISGTISPTYGCIDISASDMSKLLSKMKADKNAYIEIG